MCFPSKKQKANFEDDDKKPASKTKSASSPIPPTNSQPLTSTSSPTQTTKMAPKVAIVIYSMYGHIAKRTSLPFSLKAHITDAVSSRRG